MNNISHKFIGNEIVFNNLLENFNNNSLSKSIILAGQKGIGKSTLAINFIKKIFQIHITNKKVDHHMNLINNNCHPNLKYIIKEFDEKNKKFKNSINIEQIRNIENFFYHSSFYNLPKFILIDSANDLNNNSANSILKILEETTKNTYFILIAHQLSSILPTIRSRCLKFFINNPNIEQFSQIIKLENKDYNNDDINFLFNLTNGSPGLALNFISLNIESLYKSMIQILIENKALSPSIINLANLVSIYNNDQFKNFLILLRFILLTIIKINLGFNINNFFPSISFDFLSNTVTNVTSLTAIKILEYLNKNENDLFIYNLDKKIFILNIFSSLKENNE